MAREGLYRVCRTSARIEIFGGGLFFRLHAPGRTIKPAQLYGALLELWAGHPVPENENRKFHRWTGMSGCYSLNSYVVEWKKVEHRATQVFDVRRPLANIYVSMVGNLNTGAAGSIPEMLVLLRHFEIAHDTVRLIKEEIQEVRYAEYLRELQGLHVRVRSELAPDAQILGEAIYEVEMNDKVLESRNDGDSVVFILEEEDWGYMDTLGIVDATGAYVIQTRREWPSDPAVGVLFQAITPFLGEDPLVRVRLELNE